MKKWKQNWDEVFMGEVRRESRKERKQRDKKRGERKKK
jgi:hypothetical protein